LRKLQIIVDDAVKGKQTTNIVVQEVLVVGYGGRDLEKTKEHIRELEAIGVTPPATIPEVYPVDAANVTTGSDIEVTGQETSGEAEYVLYHNGEEWLVGVGSDHTDRALERKSVLQSKAVCPKPLAVTFWRLADVKDHWDQLVLRSWITDGNGRRKYQEHDLTALLPVNVLLDKLREYGHKTLSQVLIYSGTVPTLEGFMYGHRFEYELIDPVLNRSIGSEYTIHVKGGSA
jgi:hypothetical protein